MWIMLTFIELAPFAAVRDKYLDDEEFAALQQYLAEHPDAGDVIPPPGAAASCAGGQQVEAGEAACG